MHYYNSRKKSLTIARGTTTQSGIVSTKTLCIYLFYKTVEDLNWTEGAELSNYNLNVKAQQNVSVKQSSSTCSINIIHQ